MMDVVEIPGVGSKYGGGKVFPDDMDNHGGVLACQRHDGVGFPDAHQPVLGDELAYDGGTVHQRADFLGAGEGLLQGDAQFVQFDGSYFHDGVPCVEGAGPPGERSGPAFARDGLFGEPVLCAGEKRRKPFRIGKACWIGQRFRNISGQVFALQRPGIRDSLSGCPLEHAPRRFVTEQTAPGAGSRDATSRGGILLVACLR